MSSRLPPLNPLRAFEATARRGSVSAAARELNVTTWRHQPPDQGAGDFAQCGAFRARRQAAEADLAGCAAAARRHPSLRRDCGCHRRDEAPDDQRRVAHRLRAGAAVVLDDPAAAPVHRAISGRAADPDRLQRFRQPVFRRCRYLPALRRRQLAGLLGAAVEPAGAVSGGKPDAAQHAAAAFGARSARPCHPAWRRRARVEHLACRRRRHRSAAQPPALHERRPAIDGSGPAQSGRGARRHHHRRQPDRQG